LSTFFDTSTGFGINPLTLDFKINFELSGFVPAGLAIGDATFGSLGVTQGEKIHTLSAGEIPAFSAVLQTVNYAGIGGAGNRVVGNASTSPGSDLTININAGGGGSHNNLQPTITVLYITRFQ
jgi:microcystin-dependent protein